MNKITAQKAQSLVKSFGEKNDSQEIERFLNLIYENVANAAKIGVTNIEIELKPYAEEHKDAILKILKEDGYKAKIKVYNNWRDYDKYVRVSWDT